ncbi:Exostosin-like protein [Artemisia annua]|uniref:Exostosin-like protein n=1 Tax=Artemisia annua TaxID=35608 RepID=A0A2U1P5A1_ARTAN|nr:Exostosin-like protein [Artemisia annua]
MGFNFFYRHFQHISVSNLHFMFLLMGTDLFNLLPKKVVSIWRLVLCLFVMSTLSLVLSSLLLIRFGDISLVPRSTYKLIVADNTLSYIEHDETELKEPVSPPFVCCCDSCFKSNPTELPTSCDQNHALLKVFMHDLPPEFHFGLIGWKGDQNQLWPNVSNLSRIPIYPGGISIQCSMEYWLTLDLLSSLSADVSRPCTAIRVQNSTQADVILVPFFSSLSYNHNSKISLNEKKNMHRVLQERLMEYLTGTEEWRRSGGKDHLIMAHHPNSMRLARRYLRPAMFVLADFGRYPTWIANIYKDIIAPYKQVVTRLNVTNSPSFEERRVLVYFRGTIRRKDDGKIRRVLYNLLKDENDVHFTYGKPTPDGFRSSSIGMASSKFCLSLAGDTPSSNRLFDAIVSHCVPVIISDDIELPFEDVLDYSKFAIFVRASDASKKGYLMKLIRGVQKEKWIEMWERLKQIAPHFEYQYPSQPGDAVDMIWQAVHRKVFSAGSNISRQNRYEMSQKFLNT